MSDHDPIADLREYLEGWETGEIEEPWRAFKAAVPDAIRAFDGQALKLTEALAEAARLRAALEAHRRALIDVTRAAAVALIGNQLADGPKRDGLVKAAYRATQVLEPCPELESPAAPAPSVESARSEKDHALDDIERACLRALDEVAHESWCAIKGRCTACDPMTEIVECLNDYERGAPIQVLREQRADRDEWKRLLPSTCGHRRPGTSPGRDESCRLGAGHEGDHRGMWSPGHDGGSSWKSATPPTTTGESEDGR